MSDRVRIMQAWSVVQAQAQAGRRRKPAKLAAHVGHTPAPTPPPVGGTPCDVVYV